MSKEKITYTQALEELELILTQIENEEIDVDNLSEKVRRAGYLINECKAKLKRTEEELNQIVNEFNEK